MGAPPEPILMAGRIRTIKPEILEDERSAGLSSDAWRLWVCMWLIADDYGNLRGDSRRLAADVFWAAPVPPRVSDLLEELSATGLITRYTVRGQQYVSINNWAKHQRVDNAGKQRVPGPSEADGKQAPADTLGESPRTSETRGSDHDHDQRSPTTTTIARACVSGEKLRQAWSRAFPGQANVSPLLEVLRSLTPDQAPEGVEELFTAAAVKYRAAYLEHKRVKIPADPARLAEPKHFGNVVEVMLGTFDVSMLDERRAPDKTRASPHPPPAHLVGYRDDD